MWCFQLPIHDIARIFVSEISVFLKPEGMSKGSVSILSRNLGKTYLSPALSWMLDARRFLLAEFNWVVWESTPFHPSTHTQEASVVCRTAVLLQKLFFICVFSHIEFSSDSAMNRCQPRLSLVSSHSSLVLTLLNIFATRRYFWSEYTAMTFCFQWQRSVLAAMSRHKMPCKTASWFKKNLII